MVKKPQMRRLVLFLLLALSFVSSTFAAERSISNLRASYVGPRIGVEFRLKNGLDDGAILHAIQSGMQTGLTYRIELYRNRPNWFDDRLESARIDVVCTYDSTRKEYQLNYRRNRKLAWSQSFSDFASVREKMTHIVEQDLFVTNYRPYKLLVRVRAEVIRDHLFYVMPGERTTDWKEIRVRAAEARR